MPREAIIDTHSDSNVTAVPELPKEKQTNLALYVTAEEAYGKWEEASGAVKILDVRTPEEYIFVGHPEMAVNIPLAFQTHRWSEEKGFFDVAPNPDFVTQVKEWAKPSDVLLVMCRSGGRSAMAVNILVQAGFTDAWNITDGMEGDMDDGKRTKNGWKNADLPWTYDVDPELVRLPSI